MEGKGGRCGFFFFFGIGRLGWARYEMDCTYLTFVSGLVACTHTVSVDCLIFRKTSPNLCSSSIMQSRSLFRFACIRKTWKLEIKCSNLESFTKGSKVCTSLLTKVFSSHQSEEKGSLILPTYTKECPSKTTKLATVQTLHLHFHLQPTNETPTPTSAPS